MVKTIDQRYREAREFLKNIPDERLWLNVVSLTNWVKEVEFDFSECGIWCYDDWSLMIWQELDNRTRPSLKGI